MRISLLTLLLGSLCLFGCATTSTVPAPTQVQRVFLSGSMRWIENIRDELSYNDKGVPTVLVSGTSNSRLRKEFFIKTEWLSRSGQPIKSILSRWERVTVQPKLPFTTQAVAPRNDISDYRVFITDKIK